MKKDRKEKDIFTYERKLKILRLKDYAKREKRKAEKKGEKWGKKQAKE